MARRRRPVPPRSYLNLDGGSGSFMQTPDHADFAVKEVDCAWLFAATDWTPPVRRAFGGQWTAGWFLEQDGGSFRLFFRNGVTNTDQALRNPTIAPWADGEKRWLRVTFQPNNGADGKTLRIYHADPGPFENVVWTQLGTDSVAATAGTLGDSTVQFRVGGVTSSIVHIGRMYEAVMRKGIDGVIVAHPKFSQQPAGTTSFTDQYDKTWTLNGTASIVAE